jgi:hypothetical protein
MSKAKEDRKYCCSAFDSHSSVINNEYNSYSNMSLKLPLEMTPNL